MENIINELQELFMQMTSQQVYDKYIKPLNDNPDYILPEKGAMLFYAKKHPEEKIYWFLGARDGDKGDIKDVEQRKYLLFVMSGIQAVKHSLF